MTRLASTVAWLDYGADDFRLLAPAWPLLAALIVLSALPCRSRAACKQPHLTQLTSGSEGYAVFRVGS